MIELQLDQANDIPFVLIDSEGAEVTGLGSTFTVTLRKEAGSFAASAGTKSELGNGWYNYRATAGECDTPGALALIITGAGADQQNLVVIVRDLPADVWENTTRALTQTAEAVVQTIKGSLISVTKGTTWTIPLTGLGSLVGRSKLWFTVQTSTTDTDPESIVQIEETAGLLYINGAVAGTPENGAIVVDDESAGNITMTVKVAETVGLAAVDKLYYDVKVLISTVVTEPTRGRLNIEAVVTKAIS